MFDVVINLSELKWFRTPLQKSRKLRLRMLSPRDKPKKRQAEAESAELSPDLAMPNLDDVLNYPSQLTQHCQ